eukprot:CAMPEP_0179912176 /NCGR_PEP_ID=MMETSP0982-20121206/46765_1 /TAXON_ID=483367 /ORGANISM="non described non described, Strain CCMP 2436" /LENGTH=40 /DNA_ID= /DNA_START= /DNA_END= /DNA_ORIENTATION=
MAGATIARNSEEGPPGLSSGFSPGLSPELSPGVSDFSGAW